MKTQEAKIQLNRTVKIPQLEIEKNSSFWFVPYYVELGDTLDQTQDDIFFQNLIKEQIFTGKNMVIVQPVGWEQSPTLLDNTDNPTTTINETTRLKRNYQVNEQFLAYGIVINYKLANRYKTLKTYTKTLTEATISVYFSDATIWNEQEQKVDKQWLNWLYMAPELNTNDLLYISTITVNFLPNSGAYHSHIIQFSSLSDKLAETGRTIQQKIQFGGLGDGNILPEIRTIQQHKQTLAINNSNYFNFTDEWENIEGTKKLYLARDYSKGVKYLQVAFKGTVALLSFRVLGRKKASDGVIKRMKQLAIHQLHEPTLPATFKSEEFASQYVILKPAKTSTTAYFKEYINELILAKFEPKLKRTTLGSLSIATANNASYRDLFSYSDTQGKRIDYLPIWTREKINETIEIAGLENANANPLMSVKNKSKESFNNFTYAQFINFNSLLWSGIDFLEMGQVVLYNKKSFYNKGVRGIMGFVAGALGFAFGGKSVAGRAGGALASGFIANQISNFFNYTPASWFTSKKIKKSSPALSLLYPKEMADLITTNYPIQGDELILPLEMFSNDESQKFASYGDGSKVNNVFKFELTNKANFANVSTIADLSTTASNATFAIDLIEIKALGKTEFVLTAYDELDSPIWQLEQETQSKFSNNIRELTTSIITSNVKDDGYTLRNNWSNSILRPENAPNWPQPAGWKDSYYLTPKIITYSGCSDYTDYKAVGHTHTLISDAPNALKDELISTHFKKKAVVTDAVITAEIVSTKTTHSVWEWRKRAEIIPYSRRFRYVKYKHYFNLVGTKIGNRIYVVSAQSQSANFSTTNLDRVFSFNTSYNIYYLSAEGEYLKTDQNVKVKIDISHSLTFEFETLKTGSGTLKIASKPVIAKKIYSTDTNLKLKQVIDVNFNYIFRSFGVSFSPKI